MREIPCDFITIQQSLQQNYIIFQYCYQQKQGKVPALTKKIGQMTETQQVIQKSNLNLCYHNNNSWHFLHFLQCSLG
jgi:hypothetical protein